MAATEKQLKAIAAMNERKRLKKEEEALKNSRTTTDSSNNSDNDGEKDKKLEEQKLDEQTKLGLQIDAELKAVVDSGTKELSLEALKAKAPKTYSVVFENYEEGGENGVETSFYSATETTKGVFTISKK